MSKYKILKQYEQQLMQIEDLLSNSTTNNIQLNKLGLLVLGNDKFLGVFSSNNSPSYVRENQCFIINTDPSYSPTGGTHWVAVYKHNKKFYYYDSFNRDVRQLSKFWHKSNIVNANIDRDESFKENNCGQRALSWLILATMYSPEKIMNII